MSSSPLPLTATPRELARHVKSEWAAANHPPDARAALERHPELGGDSSAVLDLAYEEYFLRRQAGEEIDVEAFCDRFPGHRSSLRRVLAADAALLLCPDALGEGPLAPEPAAWPAAGERIGDFALRRELGRGSFARVYLATEASAGDRPVAVKLSRAGGEALLQGRLHHDNIVPVLWAGQDRVTGLHLICMPYLGSATLTHVLDRAFPAAGSAPPRAGAVIAEAVAACAWPDDPAPDQVLSGPAVRGQSYPLAVAALAAQLADGLAFLSDRQLAHCDIKPSNVLLTPGGRPLLLDFNLARGARNAQGLFGGTFAYMAPEAIEAWVARRPLGPAEAARADLFSLGAVAYELLTGRPPAGAPPRGTADEMAGWALKNLELPLVPLRERNPEVPGWLARAVEQCLALGPGARPAGARSVALALRRGARPWRRRLVGLAAAAALLGGGVLAGAAISAPPAVAPAAAHSPEPPAPPRAAGVREAGRRHLAAGWEALRVGDQAKASRALRAADEAFQQAIDLSRRQAGEGGWEDYFGRGRALMLRGETVEAIDFLGRARELRFKQLGARGEDSRLLACRAYCHAMRGQHPLAIELYQKAMEAGLRTAPVRNNLAYSYSQRRKHAEALRLVQESLRLEPGLRPALLNRAEIAFARHMAQRGPGGQPLPLWVVSDLERVIGESPAGGAAPASLYHLAARATALVLNDAGAYPLSPAEQKRLRDRGRELVVSACAQGAPHVAVCRDDDLKAALGDWLAPNNLPTARPAAERGVSAYLVDPLGAPLG